MRKHKEHNTVRTPPYQRETHIHTQFLLKLKAEKHTLHNNAANTSSITLTGSKGGGLPSVVKHDMLCNIDFASSNSVIPFVLVVEESNAC